MSQKRKILVVDDEAAIRKFLRVSLEIESYHIIEAPSAKDAIRELTMSRPELVILDLGLPDMEGLDLIGKVREWSNVPILVLTAKSDEESKVKALDAGADDYLTKPFSIPELQARLRVMWRHAAVLPESAESIFKVGKLEVDMVARIVKVAGNEVHLTATEYDILKLLIRHAGKVVTHRYILKEIWGPNAIEHKQYLRVYLGHLRRKIETNPNVASLIVTEPGVGYRLVI